MQKLVCPRPGCKGKVIIEPDIFYGPFLKCMSCGWEQSYEPNQKASEIEIYKEAPRRRRGHPITHGVKL